MHIPKNMSVYEHKDIARQFAGLFTNLIPVQYKAWNEEDVIFIANFEDALVFGTSGSCNTNFIINIRLHLL